ncbi:MAG: AAA family ATPase [Oscillospiraceae bacterium]|jgi:predicted ATPase|nr:AAA family ATPase [Oscillospiraceae bacterium]
MIYLRQIRLPDNDDGGWPHTIPALRQRGAIELDKPVTLLCGENGSGKSTLMECLAVKLAAPAVGRTDAARDESLAALRPYAWGMRLTHAKKPRATLFLRSEDFFNFILRMQQERREMLRELARVDDEYAGRGAFALNQARMTYAGAIGDMEGRYGRDLLDHSSHGESFLRLFNERLTPGGLYLLDEPEAPLSPLRQMALLSLIRRMADEEGCQFIIATHSPILLAYPDAALYSFDESPLARASFDTLESIALLRGFLNNPERYLRNL